MSMPPTTNNVIVVLACALTSRTSLLNIFTSSLFPNLSFSLAFLFDIVILYWRKIFAAIMVTIKIARRTIKIGK